MIPISIATLVIVYTTVVYAVGYRKGVNDGSHPWRRRTDKRSE